MRYVTFLSSLPILWPLSACEVDRPAELVREPSPGIAHTVDPLPTQPDPGDPISSAVDLDSPTPPPVRLDHVCEPLAAATCRVHLGCRSGVSRELLLGCEAHLTAACEAERPHLEARIAAGRLRFDASALSTCQARAAMVACAAPADMQAALGRDCDDVFVGRVTTGACVDAGDCAPGLACVTRDGSCPGTCEPLGPRGARCDTELAPCADGLTCEDGRCLPASVALGDACATTAQCPPDAYCDDATCVLRKSRGRACTDDEQCPASDYCRFLVLGDDVALETGTCEARLAAGAGCDPLIGGCADGLACDEAREVCASVPDTAGESCVADAAPCGEGKGLVCDASLCELEPMLGDACDPSAPSCRFGVCVAQDASGIGTCQDFLAPGAACSDDASCGALACVAGHCARPASRCGATTYDINVGFRYRLR